MTLGVDVASQPAGTAACRVRWDGGGATVVEMQHPVNDQCLAALLTEPVARIGLDVPLGWPDEFVAALAEHHQGRPFGTAAMVRLARRETDRWVHDHPAIRQLPLSVSTDRIAYPAMRVARILGEAVGEPIDRRGTGKFVEVYPAAALRVWGLRHRGYKRGAGRQPLLDLAGELRRRCSWLTVDGATWDRVTRTDHCFDALVCALVARARQLGLCHPIPPRLRAAAAREGWIAVPVAGSLDSLVGGTGGPGRPRT